jgi:hypothetical protein
MDPDGSRISSRRTFFKISTFSPPSPSASARRKVSLGCSPLTKHFITGSLHSKMRRSTLSLVAAATLVTSASGLALPSHFDSSMVLQRGVPVTLWGFENSGATVSVTYRGVQLPSATATAAGRFSVVLPALPANSTPDSIVLISSLGGAVTLTDVLIGDVVVCSGQSVRGARWTQPNRAQTLT